MAAAYSYKTIEEHTQAELIEKKSRFIADLYPVKSQAQAMELVEAIRKKHYDAKHHCFAYIIKAGTEAENGEKGQTHTDSQHDICRYSDDGEPSLTAGKPMMDVLTGAGVANCIVIVTRYFGGTLLGTGGLVRAYSGAAAQALGQASIKELHLCRTYAIGTDYNGYGKITYLLGQNGIAPDFVDYTEGVVIHAPIPEPLTGYILAQITEISGGKAVVEEEGMGYL